MRNFNALNNGHVVLRLSVKTLSLFCFLHPHPYPHGLLLTHLIRRRGCSFPLAANPSIFRQCSPYRSCFAKATSPATLKA